MPIVSGKCLRFGIALLRVAVCWLAIGSPGAAQDASVAHPSATWFFRSPFDAGEAGIGGMALSLEPQIDAPGNSAFFDALFADDQGNAKELSRAVALYERDGGVLWKHADYVTGHNESRRARQLVLSFFANVGNYEYGFNWVFH